MPAEHIDNLHARHVRLPVPYVYHLGERDSLLVLGYALIDLGGIP